jgi:hypothetical protein
MKKVIPGTLILALSLISHVALAGAPCDVWEYARLKDSTAEDLTAHACASHKAAKANGDAKYILIGDVGGDMRRVDEVRKAEAICKDQVKVTQSVFQQKFGKALRTEDCEAQAK